MEWWLEGQLGQQREFAIVVDTSVALGRADGEIRVKSARAVLTALPAQPWHVLHTTVSCSGRGCKGLWAQQGSEKEGNTESCLGPSGGCSTAPAKPDRRDSREKSRFVEKQIQMRALAGGQSMPASFWSGKEGGTW